MYMHAYALSRHFVQTIFFTIACICVYVVAIPVTEAQSIPQGAQINLVAKPEFPDPNTLVEISLDDYSVETAGASITWYVNETEYSIGRNERSITIPAGDLGKKTTIRAVLNRTNAVPLSASMTLIPTTIDIILEAYTHVPDFYKGRALPSNDSKARAIAVVNDNSSTPDTAYAYKWSVGSNLISGGAVKGRNVLEFDIPHYINGGIALEVFDSSGALVGKKNLPLTPVNPELHFYEHSPLRGLFEKAITGPHPLIGEETTIYGEPYYFNADMNEREADFAWEINGVRTPHNPESPNTISLLRQGGAGKADIRFILQAKTKIPQLLENKFSLIFQ